MQHGSGTPSGTIGPDRFVDAVMSASRVLVAVAARSIAQVDGSLTVPQYRTLVVLASRGPLTVGALADELGTHPSTVTRMCDRLVARGLISRRRAPESRREVIVELRPAGTEIVRQVTRLRRRSIARIVSKAPTEHRAGMVAALEAFTAAAGEVPDQAWTAGWDLAG